jgi:hypothetical protein
LAEGGPTVTGTALVLSGEARLEAIGIEDWKGILISASEGAVSVDNLHVERWTPNDGVGGFVLSGGTFRFSAINIDLSLTAASFPFVFNVSTEAHLDVSGATLYIAGSGGASLCYLIVNATGFAEVSVPVVKTGTLLYPLYPGHADTLSNARFKPSYVSGGITTVTAAATVTLPEWNDTFIVSGNTNITSVTASWAKRRVTLIFTGTPTFTDGSNLKLAGNLVATADDTITLVCDGTNWYETGRSVN